MSLGLNGLEAEESCCCRSLAFGQAVDCMQRSNIHTKLRQRLEPEKEGGGVKENPAAGGCCPSSAGEAESRERRASARGPAPGNGIGQSPADFWGLPKRQSVGTSDLRKPRQKLS